MSIGKRTAPAVAVAAAVLALAGCGGGSDQGPPLGSGNTAPIAHPLPLHAIDRIVHAQLTIERECGRPRGAGSVRAATATLLDIDRRHPHAAYRPNPGDPPRGMRAVLGAEAHALRGCGARDMARRLERR